LLPLVDLLILQRSEPACPFSRLIELRSVLEKLRSVRPCIPGHLTVVRRNTVARQCDLAHQLGCALRRPNEVSTEGRGIS
jgi:hypothetical protein